MISALVAEAMIPVAVPAPSRAAIPNERRISTASPYFTINLLMNGNFPDICSRKKQILVAVIRPVIEPIAKLLPIISEVVNTIPSPRVGISRSLDSLVSFTYINTPLINQLFMEESSKFAFFPNRLVVDFCKFVINYS